MRIEPAPDVGDLLWHFAKGDNANDATHRCVFFSRRRNPSRHGSDNLDRPQPNAMMQTSSKLELLFATRLNLTNFTLFTVSSAFIATCPPSICNVECGTETTGDGCWDSGHSLPLQQLYYHPVCHCECQFRCHSFLRHSGGRRSGIQKPLHALAIVKCLTNSSLGVHACTNDEQKRS